MRESSRDVVNALSVDVEDYFQVAGFADTIAPSQWPAFTPRVERNTERVLELLDRKGVRATFFVLGWIAERFPGLVRRIAGQGHEIACHGYSHRLIYNQHRAHFRTETRFAKALLEEITGLPVYGYRAASYSVTERSLWALDILTREGFTYDSSVVPAIHDRYGLPGSSPVPHVLTTPHGNLTEFPPTTMRFFSTRISIGGGGYFRLYPYAFSSWALRRVNRRGLPFIFYFHPWEIDPGQPRVRGRAEARVRHYLNLHKCEGRIERLLDDFRFDTVSAVLGTLNLQAGSRGRVVTSPAYSRVDTETAYGEVAAAAHEFDGPAD